MSRTLAGVVLALLLASFGSAMAFGQDGGGRNPRRRAHHHRRHHCHRQNDAKSERNDRSDRGGRSDRATDGRR